MEDLAHFIQSMSEKYGLLDASHKLHQQGTNNNHNNNNQHLQDQSSSAASNTLNSEECQGSSWECLSIFISGSQSIDCKTVPSGPHCLAPSANPKKLPTPLLQQQQADNGTASPLHCFSKLIDIDEHECPPLYNASTGTSQQQQESPDNDLSHLGASLTELSSDLVKKGTIFDSCGDLSSVVTMSDYIQQCYPRDNNNIERTQPDSISCPVPSLLTKNSGHAQQQLQQSTKNAAATSNVVNAMAALQEMHGAKENEGCGGTHGTNWNEGSGGVPSEDSKEGLLHTSRLLSQQDKNHFEHKSATGIATASRLGIEQHHQIQQAWNGRRKGVSSTSVGLDTEAKSGDFDVGLQEDEISRRTTSRDSHTGRDTAGWYHEDYQTDVRDATTKDMVSKTSFGGKSSRGQCHHAVESDDAAAQCCDAFPSFDSQGERQERQTSGGSCSSTDMSPPAENGHHLPHQQGNHGAAGSSCSLDYLPITSAMETRVALLDEASQEFFASSRGNTTQNPSQLNLASGLFENDEFRRNSSTSSETAPALKKARSFRDFSHATSVAGKEDRDPKVSMKKGNTAPSVKISSGNLDSSNNNKPPGVSLAKSRTLADNTEEEAKFVETCGQDEARQKVTGMEGGAGGGGAREPKWSHINKLLSENGFSPLDWQLITSATEVADKFFHTLNEVVRNYGRRETVVKELLAEREALLQEEKRSNEIMHKLEHETDLVKRKLATSEQRAELANAAAEKTYAVLRKDNQRLEASHASMLQRCSQLEHASRAKERALRKLQEKIQETVQREERQRQKERELYEKLKHKIAIGQKSQGEVIESNFLLRDLKPATIVGIYERQRAAAQVEMNNLRDENLRLCQELREKENSFLSKAISTAEAAQAGFDERENALFQQLTEEVNQKEDLKKDFGNLQGQLKSHAAEKQNLSMSLLQRLQMDAGQGTKSHRALKENATKQLDLKFGSALLAGNLNGCTSLKCKEFLQGICTRLKVADPGRITGAIDGLLKLVAAVPRMETFIEEVCNIFFNDGAMILARERERNSDLQETPEAVPGILKSWLEQLQSVEDLQQFEESVSAQLWERFDEKAIKHPMSARVAAASVKDLIDIERQYLLSQASYREGQVALKAEPQKLLHRIISHFQMLFEIPQLEGVMAVMNTVYIQISEYHNFSRALCSMLGLPKDARPTSIISTITSILNKG